MGSKSIEYTSGIHEIFLHQNPVSIKFSRTGECTNLKSFFNSIDGVWDKIKVIRNDKGRIVNVKLLMEEPDGESALLRILFGMESCLPAILSTFTITTEI